MLQQRREVLPWGAVQEIGEEHLGLGRVGGDEQVDHECPGPTIGSRMLRCAWTYPVLSAARA